MCTGGIPQSTPIFASWMGWCESERALLPCPKVEMCWLAGRRKSVLLALVCKQYATDRDLAGGKHLKRFHTSFVDQNKSREELERWVENEVMVATGPDTAAMHRCVNVCVCVNL